MYVNLDTNDLCTDTVEMIKRMRNLTAKKQRNFLMRIGRILKKHAVNNMTFRSGINRTDYKHMQDDVKISVKESKQGNLYVAVGGGKETGFKWRWLNDGAISNKGTVLVQATHFMEKAQKESEQEINDVIDKMLREVLEESGE